MIDSKTLLASLPTDLWIGGKQVPASGGRTLTVHNPADGQVLAEIADAQPGDGRTALDAAAAVQPTGPRRLRVSVPTSCAGHGI